MDNNTPASERLRALIDMAWEFTLSENPFFASRTGDKRYDDKVPSARLEDIQRRAAKKKQFLEKLEEISREDLSLEDKVNYDYFKKDIEDDLKEFKFKTHLRPINNVWGFHISLPQLRYQMTLEKKGDYDNYISRLESIRGYVEENMALMKKGIEEGYGPSKHSLSGCELAIKNQLVDPEESPFFTPFQNFPSSVPAKYYEDLRQRGKEAIRESVIPAYQELLEFFQRDYYPAAREEIGASSLPQGKEFYEHRVRQYTAPEYTPEEVHETGKREVERIRKDMEKVIEEVEDFSGDFDEFVDFLRTDSRFYVDTPEDLEKEVAYILKKMDGKLPGLFQHLPRTPYGIRPVPDFSAEKAPTAYYMPPPGDGSQAGFYYINTSKLDSRPLYELETLSLHEAVPGHHLQIALQQELDHLLPFRRFGGSTAYIEGWALYSERLGREVGFYSDPYSFFGHLTYEMWRACRLVVDSGIHYFDWTRDQAVEFMEKNSALSKENILSEVDRYIAWPGQALSYKMGELKIRELRKVAEERLGENFDIREFHHVLLKEGAIPLSVLEKNVTSYLNENS